jgi:hypothetical protein
VEEAQREPISVNNYQDWLDEKRASVGSSITWRSRAVTWTRSVRPQPRPADDERAVMGSRSQTGIVLLGLGVVGTGVASALLAKRD